MLPYILCFNISIFFTYLAGNKKIMLGKFEIPSCLLSFIAIFFPCFLAAIRDSSIGTDVLVYGDKLFILAKKYDNLSVFFLHTDVEKIFGTLVFVLAHISNRYIYYFILQFLVIFPIYCILFKCSSKKYAWIGMMLYFFWLYPFTLNVMRQSIAVAILIWNSINIKNKKLLKYIFWCFVAVGFHITGIIGLLLYLINFLTTCDFNKENINDRIETFYKYLKIFNRVLIIITSLIIVFIGVRLVEYITNSTGLYMDQLSFKSGGAIDFVNILLMIGLIGLIYDYRNKNETISYLFFLIIIGAILYQLKSSLSQMYRVSVYFTSFMIIIYPMILNLINNIKRKKVIIIMICLLSYLNFWYYIIIRGWHSIYPFLSSFNIM